MLRGVPSNRFPRYAILAFLLLLFGGGRPMPAAPAAAALPTAQEIDSILRELSDITGFRIRKHLPFELITRDQVNRYIKEQIRESVKPDEIHAEEVTLKKFGFAPPDFDLKKTTIDLLTEQAAAFYDYKRKKLFISDWAAVNMRDIALIHELGHALADQNFPIKKFLDKVQDDSEASLARQAVVEGQANWLMLEVSARRAGQTMADPATAERLLKSDMDSSDADYPVFNNAPLYLKRTLTFPYAEGEKFQQAVFLHDGAEAFSQVFLHPPVSSAQILHPERYFQGIVMVNPDLPKPAKHTKPFVTGTLGELETRILLEQYVGADVAEALGPKLKGSAYRIDESKPDKRLTLIYASAWSDDRAAAGYLDAYRKVLRDKWRRVEVSEQSADRFAGKSEEGYFLVTRAGNQVLSEEGFAEPLSASPGQGETHVLTASAR